MISPDTYLQFHLVFTLPVIALLLGIAWRRDTALDSLPSIAGAAVILLLAVVYTTPWDNLLIEADVWWYGDDVVWRSIWAAPVGEYLFFILQPIATLLFLSLLPIPTDTDIRLSLRERALGLAAGFGVSLLGGALVLSGDSWLYLGSTMLWGGPVLAIQWAFGWTHLWRMRRVFAVAVVVPTLYFWVADWTALSLGLWTISKTYTIGVTPFGFPFEEAFFFLITNMFVVQGFVLYLWLVDKWPTIRDSPSLLAYRQYFSAQRTMSETPMTDDDD